ncbi:hypothetical protein HMI54_014652 [Coelomomyces lativittatus]|nr:hypothetical protein HMI55_002027 [Coelomomyces lativittatus]KAJ1509007.1 hypothetical protein HMI56_007011 [Coelomomyces lativittatus]KAJ1513842.1 hypothetical protein HMI54_014652 [Coelomomyces lativittatus]
MNEQEDLKIHVVREGSSPRFKLVKSLSAMEGRKYTATSKEVTVSGVTFQLICSTSDFEILTLSLLFSEINDRNYEGYKGALIVLDIEVIENNINYLVKKSISKKVYIPNMIWQLGKFPYSLSYIKNPTICTTVFKFIRLFTDTSCIAFTLSPPLKSPFFKLLNNKSISDCCMVLSTTKKPIWVNKDIISSECPYFQQSIKKEWPKEKQEDGKFLTFKFPNFSDAVIIAVTLHLYTGWLPGTEYGISNDVLRKLNICLDEMNLEFEDIKSLGELAALAKKLDLHALAYFSVLNIERLLGEELENLSMMSLNLNS